MDRSPEEQIPRGFAGLERLISYERAPERAPPMRELPSLALAEPVAESATAPVLDALALRAAPPVPGSQRTLTPRRVSLAALAIAVAVLMGSTMISRLAPVESDPTPVAVATAAVAPVAVVQASTLKSAAPPPRTWEEQAPPKGRDIVLTHAELTYCVSEKLRLDAIQSLVDDSAPAELTALKLGMQDYLSRCGVFRSAPGALDTVRAEVDARRPVLELEARARLNSWRTRQS